MRNALTSLIYALAALAACILWLIMAQGRDPSQTLSTASLLFLGPLLYVFAYPRFLFTSAKNVATRLHGVGITAATIVFVILGSVFWKNPLRDANSVAFVAAAIAANLIFLAAAVLLFTKTRATLPSLASFLLWPYLLALALSFCGYFFEAAHVRSAFMFLCLTASLFLAFAAGAVFYRAKVAHCAALAAFVAAPWIYWAVVKDTPLGNTWTLFNVPDNMEMWKGFLALVVLTISCVALVALSIATAAIRLTPVHWNVCGTPLRDRTWPAFLVTFVFLAVWFSQSVMPYRISGAVDYSSWPLLHILHVRKRGLQFHETSVGLSGYWKPDFVSFSANDRRLFHYRFSKKGSYAELPASLQQRVNAVLDSLRGTPGNKESVRPLRSWNAEGWFLIGENIGLRAYVNGATPPPEIVALFQDLDGLPRSRESSSEMKDVCLGFCYDPLSGLGYLYANHRCGYDAARRDYVCR